MNLLIVKTILLLISDKEISINYYIRFRQKNVINLNELIKMLLKLVYFNQLHIFKLLNNLNIIQQQILYEIIYQKLIHYIIFL